MKKTELKRMLRPIVEELIQESLEEILSDPDFLNEVVKESVLKTGILTEVTSQVMTAFVRQGQGINLVSESSYRSSDDIAEEKWNRHVQESKDKDKVKKTRTVIENLTRTVGMDVFQDVAPLEEPPPENLPISAYVNSSVSVSSEEQARNPILALDPGNTGGVPLSILDQLTDVSQLSRKAGIKKR